MSVTKRTAIDAPRNKRRKLSHDSEAGSDVDLASEASDSSSEEGEGRDNNHESETPPKQAGRTSQFGRNGTMNKSIRGSAPSGLISQLDQLLAESKELRPQSPSIKNSLHQLSDLVNSTPETEALSIGEAESWLRKHEKVVIPFPSPSPPKDSNLKFCFRKPASVGLDGFFGGQVASNGSQTARIEVEMPRSILQEKDYLNLRALYKRAFYLACIAANIAKGAADNFELSYSYDDEVELLPIIRLSTKSATSNQHHAEFLIAVGFPGDVFPPGKCNPLMNCVRPRGDVNETQLEPTPFYNSCLLSKTGLVKFDKALTEKLKGSTALYDACRAGQIWLRQRGMSSDLSCGGFGAREWMLMSSVLLETGGHRDYPLFSDRYSHLQLFKAMLQILTGRDMTDPWLLRTTSFNIPPSDFPVFYDGQLGFNILYKMTPWSYQSLTQQAQLSLTSLNAKTDDNLDTVFSLPVAEPALCYDELISVSLPTISTSQAAYPQRELRRMYTVLKRGLGDRLSLLNFIFPPPASWSIQRAQSAPSKAEVDVCLMVNAETALRLVDHGPSADEQEEAVDFRQFWGEKAELRRFKDGSISESLVWTANEPVAFQVIRHLVMRHFKQAPSAVMYRSHDLEQTILPQSAGLSPTEAFKLINNQYQTLTSTLHQLEGLPLPIRSISPADPAFRSATTSNPLSPSNSTPINILIQFDSSTRWPDSLAAIQHTKIAFLVKLSDLLTGSHPSLTTRVGLENTSSSQSGYLNTSFLDIIYPPSTPALAPICFRLRIHHDRKLHLLQASLANKSLHGSVRDQFTSALATHKRDFLAAPIHTTTIRNLVTKFPPLSATIRLLKKWISSHLLSRLIPEETLEIIAARVFLHPYPWSTPGSPTTAFFRCLHFLSRWDWAFEPLIVDLGLAQDMSSKQREDVRMRFQAWRKLDPNMNNVVWFIATNVDETGVVWTQGARPEKVVAARVGALAGAAVGVLMGKGIGASEEDMKGLFVSSTAEFDFQIHLKRHVVRGGDTRKGKGKEGGFKNLQIESAVRQEDIGFDAVVLYLRDLEKAFGDTVLLFHDCEGGRVVAGLWRPGVVGRKEWRVRMGWSTRPIVVKGNRKDGEGEGEEGKKVVGEFNREAVLAEMRAMGEGIVRSVGLKGE